MKRFRLAAVAVCLALLAVPALASAHARPSAASVAVHVKRADKALNQLRSAARRHDRRAAARALRVSRTQTAAATREARRLRRTSHGSTATVRSARSLALVAGQQDEALSTYASLLDQFTSLIPVDFAQALQSALSGRDSLLSLLGGIVPVLSDSGQGGIAGLIAGLSSDDASVAQDITGAMDSLPESISAMLNDVLQQLVAALGDNAQLLQGIVPELPAASQDDAAGGIELVSQVLANVQGYVHDVLSMVTDTIGQVLGMVSTQITQVMGMIQNILGSVLGSIPGTGSSDSGSSATGTGLLGGLLGGFMQPFSNLFGFGGSSSTGLFGGLFGS